MPESCPECGAAWSSGLTCQSIFDEFLVLEFTDPGYGAVHFLTVACFMIQHGRYSPQGLAWIEQRLRDHLERGVPVAQIRQDAGRTASQSARDWKVTRQPADPPQPRVPWRMTITGVVPAYDSAASYCAAVERWARMTLEDMQPLVRS